MKHTYLILALVITQPVLADEAALMECRQVENRDDRLACYDDYVESRYLSVEQINEAAVTITEVYRSSGDKLTLALDNGQVWQQIGSTKLRLVVGDAVIIRSASLGSFKLEKETGSRRIRVRRLN